MLSDLDKKELRVCISHFRSFFTDERVKSEQQTTLEKFKRFSSTAVAKYPEFCRQPEFIQEIKRIQEGFKNG